MRRITLHRLLTCCIAAVLLFLGYTPASSQYYMNVFKKNGEIVQFAVAELDSVYYTSSGVTPTPSGQYEYVDLGLSVNWATLNVGASKPEEYGIYYAWGETEPKRLYSWRDYKFNSGGSTIKDVMFSKYNTSSNYGQVDNKTVLDPEDDVAHVIWGGNWRMPTKAEWDELYSNCTWTWYASGNSEFGGMAGYKVTGKKSGHTDRYIFLPAVGCRERSQHEGVGSEGIYWSSSLSEDYPDGAYMLFFESVESGVDEEDRYVGLPVRPVCP